MIDLAGSSSDEESIIHGKKNKRKNDNGIKPAASASASAAATATTRGEGSIRVSSSPSLSPLTTKKMPPNPSRELEKMDALRKARRWHEEGKRGRFGDRQLGGGNVNAPVAADVDSAGSNVGVPPASFCAPDVRPGGGISEAPAVAPSSFSLVGIMAPRLRKMGRREARGRARRWAESRRSSAMNEDEDYDEEVEDNEEGVIDLSSPSADYSPPSPARMIGHINEEIEEITHLCIPPPPNIPPSRGRPSYPASSSELPRRSAANGMGRPTLMETQQQPLRSDVAMSSNAAAVGRARSESRRREQWACPRCTLLNDWDHAKCEACLHENTSRRNNNGNGSGGPSRGFYRDFDNDDRFVLGNGRGSTNDRAFGSTVPTATTAAAAAAAGGASNSANRMSQGTALVSSYRDIQALNGAEEADSFRALGHGYRNTGTAFNDLRGALDGMIAAQESLASSDGGGWGRPRNFNHGVSRNSAFLSHLLQAMTYPDSRLGPRESLDDMSYDRLLQLFGDGGENRGASSETITSLPVSTIVDPERELPMDKRQCCICLEDFCQGEERTSLPCLHGFHTACVNRWLSSNGSCPVCKTSVRGD